MKWPLLCGAVVVLALTACGGLTERDPAAAGTGCALAMIASGELPAAEASTSRFSGPGLAAIYGAFVLVWRENLGMVERMTVSRLSDEGTLVEVEVVEAEGCASWQVPTGLGATSSTDPPPSFASSWMAHTGVAVTAFKNCGSSIAYGGEFMVHFNGRQALGSYGAGGGSDTEVATSAQPVARAQEPLDNYFAYVQRYKGKSRSELRRIYRSAPLPDVIDPFDGATPGYVNLASSESLVAVAGSIPADGAVRLQAFAQPWPLKPIGQHTLPLSDWVSLTAWGSRIAILAPSSLGPAVTIVEAGAGGVAQIASEHLDAPPPSAGAVATLRDRLLVATTDGNAVRVQQSSGFTLRAEATTTLFPSGYQGKLIALAAARQRVAVAWLNEGSVPAGTSPGGWALLECAE